jgi:hypothetical protein
MILFGQFFLMNLILAVIFFSFIKAQEEDVNKEIEAYNILKEKIDH